MKSTKEELEARWKIIWARGQELKERQAQLQEALPSMDAAMVDRALDQLHQDREQHERDLLQLRVQMEECGEFEE